MRRHRAGRARLRLHDPRRPGDRRRAPPRGRISVALQRQLVRLRRDADARRLARRAARTGGGAPCRAPRLRRRACRRGRLQRRPACCSRVVRCSAPAVACSSRPRSRCWPGSAASSGRTSAFAASGGAVAAGFVGGVLLGSLAIGAIGWRVPLLGLSALLVVLRRGAGGARQGVPQRDRSGGATATDGERPPGLVAIGAGACLVAAGSSVAGLPPAARAASFGVATALVAGGLRRAARPRGGWLPRSGRRRRRLAAACVAGAATTASGVGSVALLGRALPQLWDASPAAVGARARKLRTLGAGRRSRRPCAHGRARDARLLRRRAGGSGCRHRNARHDAAVARVSRSPVRSAGSAPGTSSRTPAQRKRRWRRQIAPLRRPAGRVRSPGCWPRRSTPARVRARCSSCPWPAARCAPRAA